MRKHTAILLMMLAVALSAHAQLIPENAEPEKVVDGYKFTEGPALGPDGCIYFTDIPAQLILKHDPKTKETSTYASQTGEANGLMFTSTGNLRACRHAGRDVAMLDILATRTHDNQAQWATGHSIGKIGDIQLNSPNDLAIDKKDNFYFTDPRYGNRDNMAMEVEGVYYAELTLEGPEGLQKHRWVNRRIDADLVRPNGIVLSPDEKILYVADNGANWIYAYDIEEPGKVKNKRKFAQINDGKGGGSDGMCVDKLGRLYATGHGKVWVFEPTGQLVATISVGPQTTNCTFGADGKTLYITANKGLYRITLNTDAPLEHAEKPAE